MNAVVLAAAVAGLVAAILVITYLGLAPVLRRLLRSMPTDTISTSGPHGLRRGDKVRLGDDRPLRVRAVLSPTTFRVKRDMRGRP